MNKLPIKMIDWYQKEIEDIYKDDDTLLTFLLSDNSYIEGGNDNE